jgi:hypothetical protein
MKEHKSTFLNEIIDVCKKHGLCIVPAHEMRPTLHDPMLVAPFDETIESFYRTRIYEQSEDPNEFVWEGREEDEGLSQGFAWLICHKLCKENDADALATVWQNQEQYGDDLFHWTVHGRTQRGRDREVASGTADTMESGRAAADAIIATMSDEEKRNHCVWRKP